MGPEGSGDGERDGGGDGDGDGDGVALSSPDFLSTADLACFGGSDGEGESEGAGEGDGDGEAVVSSSATLAGCFEADAAAFRGGDGEGDAVASSSSSWFFFVGKGIGFAFAALRGGDGEAETLDFAARFVAGAFDLGGGEGDAEAVASLSCSSWPPPRKFPFLIFLVSLSFAGASAFEAETVSEPESSCLGRAFATGCLLRPEDLA